MTLALKLALSPNGSSLLDPSLLRNWHSSAPQNSDLYWLQKILVLMIELVPDLKDIAPRGPFSTPPSTKA